MGRGCAQLGKAVKGKSKERKKTQKNSSSGNKLTGQSGVISSEKQLNEDMKMLEEYEKMNKLAEQQRTRLKKLLHLESYNTRLNKKLLTNLYRASMRLEKVDALRREIDIVSQSHTRDLERKDNIIHMLVRDIEENEEQYRLSQRVHMLQLSKLVEMNMEKLTQLEMEYERDLHILKEEFLTERQHLKQQHQREISEMVMIYHSVESSENESILESKQAHETEREEIRNKNLEAINELRINLENKIEDLERQFDDAHSSYVESTSQANDNFKKLKSEDAILSLHIYEKKKKIVKLQNNLISWRKKLEYNSKECTARNNALREQKDALNKHCTLLKGKMKKFRQSEAKRLTELTLLSRDALISNQKSLAQTERILYLVEYSRSRETEREKVQPWYESTVIGVNGTIGHQQSSGGGELAKTMMKQQDESKEQQPSASNSEVSSVEAELSSFQKEHPNAVVTSSNTSTSLSAAPTTVITGSDGSIPTCFTLDSSAAAAAAAVATSSSSQATSASQPSLLSHTQPTSLQPVSPYNQLDNFYKKYNKVLLDKLAITQEKQRLQQENADLRSILKQYLDGVAITSNAVDQENPLLIVNNRINLVPQTEGGGGGQVRRGRPKTTQELTHLVQTTQRHTGTMVRAVAHG